MKTFLILTTLFMISISFLLGNTENERKTFIDKCLKPTILIESATSSASGTGFITNSIQIEPINCYLNVVFSCEHILKSTDLIIKCSDFDENGIFQKYKVFKGAVAATDGANDLSLIFFLSPTKMPCVDLDQKYIPKIKDNLFSVGHAIGEPSRFAEGKLTGVMRSETTNSLISYRTSVSIVFGDSGGPLFFENKVIGIANSMRNVDIGDKKHPVYDISFYKPLSLMEGILKDNFIQNGNFQDFKTPEIMALMLWAKSLEIEN